MGPAEGNWEWCLPNVEKRLESWNILVTVIGLLAAFVIDALLNVESHNWSEDGEHLLALHAYCLSLSAALLVTATLLLAAVIWNTTRLLGHDEWLMRQKDEWPGLEHFQVGYGAWRRLKLLTEESILGFDVVNTSGKAFLLGTFSYFVGVSCKLIASIDQLYIHLPCCIILLGFVTFAVGCVFKMGVNLS